MTDPAQHHPVDGRLGDSLDGTLDDSAADQAVRRAAGTARESGIEPALDPEPSVVRLDSQPQGRAVPVRFETSSLRRAALVVLLVFAAFEVAVWAFVALEHFLFLLLLSWLLSIGMEPAVAWLANRGLRRGVATGIVGGAIVLATLGFLAVFGSVFFGQLAELVKQLPDTVTQIVEWANNRFGLAIDPQRVLAQMALTPESLATIASNLAGGVFGVLGLVFGTIFDSLTVLVFAFYFSADGPRMRRAIGSWLPMRSQKVFVNVWDIAVVKTGGFVVSKVVLAALSAFFHCTFFYLIQVPYWLPMGIFAGIVSQFIPTIGTYIGIVVPAIFAAFNDPIEVVWIIAFATVYQQIESYVFTPRVSRATMDVHPALALGAVFVGVALFGPIGAIIGIPLAAAIVAIVETYGQRHDLMPELKARTKGEKPARPGDPLAGDPATVVPAGTNLSDSEVADDSGPVA